MTSRSRTQPPPTRPRLLIVDDEAYNTELVVRTFHRSAIVVGAADAAEALARLAAEPFELALLDHRLADGTGLELARALRARWPRLRLVVVTGYADDPALRAAHAAGELDDLIGKPWTPAELRRRVDELLRRPG